MPMSSDHIMSNSVSYTYNVHLHGSMHTALNLAKISYVLHIMLHVLQVKSLISRLICHAMFRETVKSSHNERRRDIILLDFQCRIHMRNCGELFEHIR